MEYTESLPTETPPTIKPAGSDQAAPAPNRGTRLGCWKLTRRTRTGIEAGQVLEHRLEYLARETVFEARGRAWSAALLDGHTPETVTDGLRWVQDDEHHGPEAVTVTVTERPPGAASGSSDQAAEPTGRLQP